MQYNAAATHASYLMDIDFGIADEICGMDRLRYKDWLFNNKALRYTRPLHFQQKQMISMTTDFCQLDSPHLREHTLILSCTNMF